MEDKEEFGGMKEGREERRKLKKKEGRFGRFGVTWFRGDWRTALQGEREGKKFFCSLK